MYKKEAYAGIDLFRVIAAFLIVAIHISPLAAFSVEADFILTHIIARIAVPFFFMTSGFFINGNQVKIKSFMKKTAILYGTAILLYLPINIYNGYFSVNNLLPNIIKDIIFDGTIYHLWYLPAAIIGAAVMWLLVAKCGIKWAFAITVVLYIIGLFGDSYFGFSAQVPFINGFYSNIFEITEYTRNGIFFVPLFFVLGGIIARQKRRTSFRFNVIGFAVSFALMITEGLLLHNLSAMQDSMYVMRHDSMYIMLVPCMFFMFTALTFFKGRRKSVLRTSAMIIYIIHPMIIIVVRMVAKALGIKALLVDNNLILYFVVSILSACTALAVLICQKRLTSKRRPISKPETDRSWIELSLEHLRHNANALQQEMPVGCELMAVVKAQAYGHNAAIISSCLNDIGVNTFAVATIDEAIELRKCGIKGDILIMGYTNPIRAKELHRYDLTQTLIDHDYAVSLNRRGYRIKAHIKIDTGMHRLGYNVGDVVRIAKAFKARCLDICGIYSHLCVSDSLDEVDTAFTHEQIATFYTLLEELTNRGIQLPKIHLQSSNGLLNYPGLKCDYARIGIALYGALSHNDYKTHIQPDLRPVLSLKSRVVLIREVAAGECIGYGRRFTTSRRTRMAILPIGYADGLPRSLSCGNNSVLLHGSPAPIIGMICMDQLIIDITDLPDVIVGDVATIIGRDGQAEITAAMLAENTDSITNELLSRIGSRLKVVE